MSADKPSWRVKFTSPVKKDIKDIFSFIAETILSRFIQARDSLGKLHDRGHIPPEMRHINVFSYREIQVPPYRVVYQVHQAIQEVHIHIVTDGRRNFTELLKKRLLTPTD